MIIGSFILLLMCMAIGTQLIFFIGNVSRIHTVVDSSVRATVSSVNSAMGRFFSAVFLIGLNFLPDKNTISPVTLSLTLMIFLIVFVCVIGWLFPKMAHQTQQKGVINDR